MNSRKKYSVLKDVHASLRHVCDPGCEILKAIEAEVAALRAEILTGKRPAPEVHKATPKPHVKRGRPAKKKTSDTKVESPPTDATPAVAEPSADVEPTTDDE